MGKVVILTDSSSGIRQAEAQQLGISVLPMPFFINGETLFEDINLTQDTFYEHLTDGAEISTSMPAVGDLTDRWDELLKEYDEIVYIPLSSGLSSSCETATALSSDEEYEGKVFVVNNQRISVTQKQSVFDAIRLAESGKSGKEIKDILEDAKFQSSIYIMVDTLYYLKKGGRITPAAAAYKCSDGIPQRSGSRIWDYRHYDGSAFFKCILPYWTGSISTCLCKKIIRFKV